LPIKGFNKKQKEFIHRRDNGQCQFLGCKSRGTQVHHIVPKSYAKKELHWSLAKINNVNNGVLLCAEHHRRVTCVVDWRDFVKYFESKVKSIVL